MNAMKRPLPTLRSLEMFEAAARHGSFTRAAEELAITQSALSRQIALLEAYLGLPLFERIRRRVVLTEIGAAYADKVRVALARIQSVTMDVLTAGTIGDVLHVASLSTFAAQWLAPRLVSFADANPDIALNVTTYQHLSFDLAGGEPDIVIHYGEPSWPGAVVEPLMPETIVVVCSPRLLQRVTLASVDDLRRAPLIQQSTHMEAWADWLAAAGGPGIDALKGPRFEHYAMIVEGAVSGLGVAAVPSFLIDQHLAAGTLVMPFSTAVRSRHSYCTAVPEARRNLPKIRKFRAWLKREVKRAGYGRAGRRAKGAAPAPWTARPR